MTCGVDKNACKLSKTHAYLNIFKSFPSGCTEASDEENYIICLVFVKPLFGTELMIVWTKMVVNGGRNMNGLNPPLSV